MRYFRTIIIAGTDRFCNPAGARFCIYTPKKLKTNCETLFFFVKYAIMESTEKYKFYVK